MELGSAPRSGCWTCRLRRKRCDRARPVCQTCKGLEISCFYGETKPDWMDGAVAQKEMSKKFKTRIRERAVARRYRARSTQATFITISQQDYAIKRGDKSEQTLSDMPQALPLNYDENSHLNSSSSTTESHQASTMSATDAPDSSTYVQVPSETPQKKSVISRMPLTVGSATSNSALGRASELDSIMIYLDFAFPFLYPYYQPPLIGTSRAWLLSFTGQNRAVLHSVLSFSSFFFTVGLNDVFPGERKTCKSVWWKEAVQQVQVCYEMMQKDLLEISERAKEVQVIEKARFVETITQLLIFEQFIGASSDWNIHLTIAITLSQEIFAQVSLALLEKPLFESVLEQMIWPLPRFPGGERPLWNPEQATFRFFMATLLFVDIIASTSLEIAPRLGNRHDDILADIAPDIIGNHLDFSAFIGCQNWAMLAIGRITALDRWKKDMKQSQRLSQRELVFRADPIYLALEEGFTRLNSDQSIHDSSIIHLQPFYKPNLRKTGKNLSVLPTRIWGHAARIYLSVVVFGWTASEFDAKQDIDDILSLLRGVDTAAQMHTFAWPICIAGCLAELEEQRQSFREIINGAGNVQLLSAIQKAAQIMEAVWSIDKYPNRQDKDIAACLRILGTPALLI